VHATLTLLPPQQRIAGKWAKPQADVVEPARTERLLAAPFTIFWSHGADYLDAYALCLLPKTSGDLFIGLCFQWLTMLVQVTLGIVSGLGPYITKGTVAATAQVVSVASVKLLWAASLTVYRPCACGLTNAVVAAQCLSEGTATILLLLAPRATEGIQTLIQTLCFLLLLIPVFIPIFQKIYDGFIAHLVTACCRKKKVSRETLIQEMVKWLLALPALISKFSGVNTGSFNPAKLTVSAMKLLADAKQQRAKKVGKVKVKRTVKRTVKRNACPSQGIDEVACIDPATTMAAAVGAVGAGLGLERRSSAKDMNKQATDAEGEDGGGDDGDGDGGGGDE